MNRKLSGAPAAAGAREHRTRAPGGRLIRASALGVLSCAVATAGLVVPADAVVNAAHTVFVLKDDSIVEAEGYRPNESVLIQVKRNNVVVGSARASSLSGALAVNHDSCWDDYTPVILAGDVVEVTSSTGTDRVTVAGVSVLDDPAITGAGTGTIRGRIEGTPPPVGELEVFVRSEDPNRFRAIAPGTFDRGPEGNTVTGTIAYDAPGDFTATFTGMTAEQEAQFTSGAEFYVAHAPAANEMTQATGASPVPGPGCGVDAPTVAHAVTAVTPAVVGGRNAGATVRVQGFSQAAGTVTVELRDEAGTVVTGPAALTGTEAQTWTASFSSAETAELHGRITVSADIDGAAAPVTRTLLKDLVAPGAPTASLASGNYRRAQFVTLNAGAGDAIRYTIGNGRQAPPNARRGTLYRGGQIKVRGSQVLKMVAIDEAGNVSRVARERYVILRRAGKPQILRAAAGARGGRTTAIARWRAPAGSQVSGYRVKALRLRPNGTVASRTQSALLRPRRQAMQMRLSSGRYRFQVRAVNALGNGPWSARSNVVRAR